jgi:hypothetical protein
VTAVLAAAARAVLAAVLVAVVLAACLWTAYGPQGAWTLAWTGVVLVVVSCAVLAWYALRPKNESSPGASPDDEPTPDEPHIELLEAAWGIIANAGWDAFSGRVDLAKSPGWHEAAVRWRDDYHRWLDLHLRPGGHQTWEELAIGVTRERDALACEVTELRRALRDTASAELLAKEDPRDG